MRIAILVTIMKKIDNLIIRGVPVTSAIVELDDQALMIIDTGMVGNPDLLNRLDDMGLKPSDFNFVFNSHLHPDHIGGNRHFTNARIIVSHKELAHYQSMEELPSVSVRNAAVPENMLSQDLRKMRETYHVSNLLGDPAQIEFLENHPLLPSCIRWITAAGHSIDDQVVILAGRTKNVLVAGDALYHRYLWREPTPRGINLDEDLFRKSATKLSEFQGIIVPGHDLAFDNPAGTYLEINKFISI